MVTKLKHFSQRIYQSTKKMVHFFKISVSSQFFAFLSHPASQLAFIMIYVLFVSMVECFGGLIYLWYGVLVGSYLCGPVSLWSKIV